MTPTQDYYSFILSFSNVSLPTFVALFTLALMRMAPVVAIAPFLGAKLPGSVKMGLTICLTVILLPTLITNTTHPMAFDAVFIGYCVKEVLIGTMLAMLCTLPFYIAQSAGVLIDFARGSSALQVTDPTVQSQASPLGLLYNYVFIVLFFEIGGPFIFFQTLLRTYQVLPVDVGVSSYFFSLSVPFWQGALSLLTYFLSISIQLAAPSLVAILMAEAFLGIANRLAPQVQIAFLGMSIKSLLGLAMLWAGWFFILQQVGKQSLLWLQKLDFFIDSMKI